MGEPGWVRVSSVVRAGRAVGTVTLLGCTPRNGHDARAKSQFRYAEIQNLGLALRGQEDVRGLDVAVNDALAVCRLEPRRNLDGEVEQRVDL